ncbi:MAG: hypothetical protein WC378_18420 [Opitutaceae bacterium]|jgi:hypothetical protein
MSKGLPTTPDTTEETALEDESLATAQEAIPVPLFAGEVKVAGRFWSPIYGQRAKQAPDTRPGKK